MGPRVFHAKFQPIWSKNGETTKKRTNEILLKQLLLFIFLKNCIFGHNLRFSDSVNKNFQEDFLLFVYNLTINSVAKILQNCI